LEKAAQISKAHQLTPGRRRPTDLRPRIREAMPNFELIFSEKKFYDGVSYCKMRASDAFSDFGNRAGARHIPYPSIRCTLASYLRQERDIQVGNRNGTAVRTSSTRGLAWGVVEDAAAFALSAMCACAIGSLLSINLLNGWRPLW